MSLTVHLKINGQTVEAPPEATVLETARRIGIYIPTLCHHEALEPEGVCRLCIVAVSDGGKQSLRPSCMLKVAEGMVVETDSKRIHASRQMMLKRLLKQAPNSSIIREMAERYGVPTDVDASAATTGCVLCGRCVQVCRDKIGAGVYAFEGRGKTRKVVVNADKLGDCIGCGACAQICPTDAIQVVDDHGERKIIAWGDEIVRFELENCEHCGTPYAPKRYLDYINRRAYVPKGIELIDHICPKCFQNGDRASKARRDGALRKSLNKWSVPRR